MAKILLAEDDSTMRHFIRAALEKKGHEVTDCSNGQDALLQLHKHQDYTLLLTDIVMPGVDGIELAQKAQTLIPTIKTMFITGFSAVSVGKNEKTEHNAAILSKPFHLKDLVEQIEKLIKN